MKEREELIELRRMLTPLNRWLNSCPMEAPQFVAREQGHAAAGDAGAKTSPATAITISYSGAIESTVYYASAAPIATGLQRGRA